MLYDKFTVIKREKLTNAKQRTSKLHVIKVVDNNMITKLFKNLFYKKVYA